MGEKDHARIRADFVLLYLDAGSSEHQFNQIKPTIKSQFKNSIPNLFSVLEQMF